MKVFSASDLNALTQQACSSSRLRKHHNIHDDYQAPCQRLFNAIEQNSYIRPHRHANDSREELLMAVRGLMALLIFDDGGNVTRVVHFGSEKYAPDIAAGVEVAPNIWHTVVALVPGSILLEVKEGPFDPTHPKDAAPWAPEELSSTAPAYMAWLVHKARWTC